MLFSAYLEIDSTIGNRNAYLFTYSFKCKEWKIKGKLTKELTNFAKKKYGSVWTGEYLILYNKELGPDFILIVDPFKNIHYKYYTSEEHFFMNNCEVY